MADGRQRRVVLTGAPGTGKTTVLGALRESHAVVEEPARRIIAEHRERTGRDDLDAMPDVFVGRMAERMVSDFEAAAAGTTIHDRGLPDCIAYLAAYGRDTESVTRLACRHRYEGPIFLFPPWREIYTTDDMRKATFAQVEDFHDFIVDAYRTLGYDLVEVPRLPVEIRPQWVSDRIG